MGARILRTVLLLSGLCLGAALFLLLFAAPAGTPIPFVYEAF